MILSFILSMPSNNSWDSHWSGEDKLYAKVISFGNSIQAKTHATEILKNRYYSYNFGDGWTARIDVKEIDANEAAKIKRKSNGFCGYDWMIESIKNNLKIEVQK